MRAAEAAAVGAVLAAFAAAEWAVWLSRQPSAAQEAVPPARALVTWAYTDAAPATEAEADYYVRWNATGLAWAGDAVWRIHRVVDSEDPNDPLRPCPLRVTRGACPKQARGGGLMRRSMNTHGRRPWARLRGRIH